MILVLTWEIFTHYYALITSLGLNHNYNKCNKPTTNNILHILDGLPKIEQWFT